MQNLPSYSLVRRLLFPYDASESLSVRQGLRVVLVWAFLFSSPITLLALGLMILEGWNEHEIIGRVVFIFLSSAFLFGMLSLLIVLMSNRAAHIRQAWKARNGQS